MMEMTEIHWTDSPYTNTSKFTLKRGGVFLIKVSNQGSHFNKSTTMPSISRRRSCPTRLME